jgi:23S rRNA pseudouridine955/2504/2580 synthase
LNDRVRIPPLRRPEPGADAGDQSLFDLREAIVYEDKHLLVLNKPAGVAVHGGTGLRGGLIEFMRAQTKDHLELIHRLDKDTSGALMLAKDSRTLRAMHAVLRHPERDGGIKKTYQALLVGRWRGGKRELKHRLQTFRDPGQMKRSVVSSQGREAHSIFNPVTRFFEHTLMNVEIKTGRLHQVRAHAKAIGHPVAGDRVYGTADANRQIRQFGLTRQFLHADHLVFQHPIEKRQLDIHAPLPKELDSVLRQLQTQLADSRSS